MLQSNSLSSHISLRSSLKLKMKELLLLWNMILVQCPARREQQARLLSAPACFVHRTSVTGYTCVKHQLPTMIKAVKVIQNIIKDSSIKEKCTSLWQSKWIVWNPLLLVWYYEYKCSELCWWNNQTRKHLTWSYRTLFTTIRLQNWEMCKCLNLAESLTTDWRWNESEMMRMMKLLCTSLTPIQLPHSDWRQVHWTIEMLQ